MLSTLSLLVLSEVSQVLIQLEGKRIKWKIIQLLLFTLLRTQFLSEDLDRSSTHKNQLHNPTNVVMEGNEESDTMYHILSTMWLEV